MLTGFLMKREQLMRIEIVCARVSDLLQRARALETNGFVALAEVARERAVQELASLERPDPTSPFPCMADQAA